MKTTPFRVFAFVIVLIMSTVAPAAASQQEGAVVQAVFFFSPTCPHCHIVMDDVFPPLADHYGDRLQILQIDVTQQTGQTLYQTAVTTFRISQQRRGVPTLIVDDVVLVGSQEIPARFPGLIEQGLAAGGIGWPDIPGLDRAYPDLVAPTAGEEAGAPVNATPVDPAAQPTAADPVGAVLAAVLLLAMLGALVYVALQIANGRLSAASLPPMRSSTFPALILFGLLIAFYMSYVELTHTDAICGPIGDCNIVQTSAYARFLGVPVALIGVANYLALGALWLGQRVLDGPRPRYASLAIVALTVAATLFAVYLTALELFVIEAVCAWCLVTAAIVTALMVISVQFVAREGRPVRHRGHRGRRVRRLDT